MRCSERSKSKQQITGQLKQSEERFRLLYTLMRQGAALHGVIIGSKGKALHHRFLDANPNCKQLTGLKASDIIGRTDREVVAPA